MGVTVSGPSPSVGKPLPDTNPIHPPPPAGSAPITQPTSAPAAVGTGGDPGRDRKEAILAPSADRRPAASVCPKESGPASKRSPSPHHGSDSSGSDSHLESGDRWAKTQREANREGDWELASNITAFPVIHRKGKKAYASWEPLPYGELKHLCKPAKEHGRSSFYFKNLLEATFSAHVLVPHDIKSITHCLLTPAECMLRERCWKKHLIAISDAYSKDTNRQNFTIEQLTGERLSRKELNNRSSLPEPMASTAIILAAVSGKLPAEHRTASHDNIKSEAVSLSPTHHPGEYATSPDPADLPYRAIQVGTRRQLVSALTIHFVDECVFRIPTGKYGAPDGPQDILITGDIVNGPNNFHGFPEMQTVGLNYEILVSLCCTDTPFQLYQGTPIAQAFLLPKNYSEQVPLNPAIMWTQIVGSSKPIVECTILCRGEEIFRAGLMDTGADVTIVARSEWPSHWELQPVTGRILGVGGVAITMRSKHNIIVEGPEGKIPTIRLSINWVRPLLGITTEDLAPLFNLLRGNEDVDSPHSLTSEAQESIKKVQEALSSCQAHRYEPRLPFQFAILAQIPSIAKMKVTRLVVILAIIWMHFTTQCALGWIVPQPSQNVWVTLAKSL
ncbi:hypothetical protein TURU_138670 [Turdus rufiventris]|nr:hypothetical protein TURU_138670 [Turdus rufiventris]